MTLWEALKSKTADNLEQTVSENDAKMTFGELIVFAEDFAKKLSGQGCCAIYCDSEMAASMALLACFAAGVTAVPLSKKYGENHCRKIIELIGPTCVISDMQGSLEIYDLNGAEYSTPEAHPALIMCTSGTTGRPKGAMLSETNILTNIKDITEYFDIGKDDTILIARPLYHCAVLTGEFLVSLVKGARVVFCSGPFDPGKLINIIEEQGITVFCATPTFLNMLIRFIKKNKVLNVKSVVVSGECLAAPIGKRIREAFACADIYHVYGLTEACPRVCFLPPEYFDEYPEFVGVPLASVSVRIRNKEGKEASVGEEGVLWVKGGNVMIGYYNDSEHTSKVLKDGWLCTGDIAVKNDKGLIKILGRNDDLIICAGMNIYPGEIEAAMLSEEKTREVFVYGERDGSAGMKPVMEIVGSYATVDEVREVCKRVLAPYQMPAGIKLLKKLNKNGSGKVIRRR